jgi:hypothetical protein
MEVSMKGWVELQGVKHVYGDIAVGDFDFDFDGVRERVVVRKSGWEVVQAVSKKWWALHYVKDDVGPFDTKEEAQRYVEVTYALEE